MVHFISSLKNVVISFHLKGKKREQRERSRERVIQSWARPESAARLHMGHPSWSYVPLS